MALQGKRVGVVDACLTAPTLHLLFGLSPTASFATLNDFLLGHCGLAAAAQRVQLNSSAAADLPAVVLVPADPNPATVARAHHLTYDLGALGAACQQFAADLGLDALIVDTEAGLPPGTMNAFAAANAVLLVLTLDKQHYQGAARTVDIVNALQIPHRKIVVNPVVPWLDQGHIATSVSQTYGWEVAAVIPYCDELMVLASASLFALRYPAHSVSAKFHQIAASLL